jgi:hypothetical protein
MQVSLSLVPDVTVKGVLSSNMPVDTDSDKQAWNNSPETHLAYRKAMEDDLNGGFKSVSIPSSLTGQYMDAEGNHAGAVRFSRASGGQGSAHRANAGAIGRSQRLVRKDDTDLWSRVQVSWHFMAMVPSHC